MLVIKYLSLQLLRFNLQNQNVTYNLIKLLSNEKCRWEISKLKVLFPFRRSNLRFDSVQIWFLTTIRFQDENLLRDIILMTKMFKFIFKKRAWIKFVPFDDCMLPGSRFVYLHVNWIEDVGNNYLKTLARFAFAWINYFELCL